MILWTNLQLLCIVLDIVHCITYHHHNITARCSQDKSIDIYYQYMYFWTHPVSYSHWECVKMPQVLTHALIPTFLQLILIPGHWSPPHHQPSFPRDPQVQSPDCCPGRWPTDSPSPPCARSSPSSPRGRGRRTSWWRSWRTPASDTTTTRKGYCHYNYRALLWRNTNIWSILFI